MRMRNLDKIHSNRFEFETHPRSNWSPIRDDFVKRVQKQGNRQKSNDVDRQSNGVLNFFLVAHSQSKYYIFIIKQGTSFEKLEITIDDTNKNKPVMTFTG